MLNVLLILGIFGFIVAPMCGVMGDILSGFGLFLLRLVVWFGLLLVAAILVGAFL